MLTRGAYVKLVQALQYVLMLRATQEVFQLFRADHLQNTSFT